MSARVAVGQGGGSLAVMGLPGGLGIDGYMTKPKMVALMADRPWRRLLGLHSLGFHFKVSEMVKTTRV